MRELERELNAQNALNEDLRVRNQKLRSEVSSLRDGLDAIEERARFELGMIGNDEIYVQLVTPVVSSNGAAPSNMAASSTPAPSVPLATNAKTAPPSHTKTVSTPGPANMVKVAPAKPSAVGVTGSSSKSERAATRPTAAPVAATVGADASTDLTGTITVNPAAN